MTADAFITEMQVKEYFDNPPATMPTKGQIEAASALIDKYFVFIGEPTNDC